MIKQRVKVKPSSSKNQLIVLEDGSWEIKLLAKPIDGEANIELLHFLSKKLNIAKSKIVIEKGLTTRYKTLVIHEDVINI
jgi:uncharacterized protein